MSYLVIDNDGHIHHRTAAPTSAAITAEVGEPGWAMVRIGPGLDVAGAMGWVNDCGHLFELPYNVVGSCLLASLGAAVMPYAGPVVLTGWHHHDEIVALKPGQVDAMRLMHSDIRRVLHLEAGEPSDVAPDNWRQAMAQVAELVAVAPRPTPVILHPGDPGWPL